MERKKMPLVWHALDETQLLERVSAGEIGCSSTAQRPRCRGEDPPWRVVAAQLHHPLIYLLLGAAAVLQLLVI